MAPNLPVPENLPPSVTLGVFGVLSSTGRQMRPQA